MKADELGLRDTQRPRPRKDTSEAVGLPSPPRSWIRRLGLALLFLLVFLTTIEVPTYAGCSGGDCAWAMLYGHFLATGAQPGIDYVFNYGPFGYLLTHVYHPDLFALRVGWGLVFAVSFAGIVTGLVGMMRGGPLRGLAVPVVFAIGVLAMPTLWDGRVFLALPAAAFLVLGRQRPATWLVCGVLLFILAVGFIKLSAAVLGAVCIAMVLWHVARRPGGGMLRAGWMAAACILIVLGVWLALGYSLSGIDDFVRSSLAIVGGYSEEMALAGSNRLLVHGLVALGGLGVVGLLCVRRAGCSLGGLALFGLAAFMAFKFGYVRQDAHMMGFFFAAALLPGVLWASGSLAASRTGAEEAWSGRWQTMFLVSWTLVFVVSVSGLHALVKKDEHRGGLPIKRWPAFAYQTASETLGALTDLGAHRAKLELWRDQARAAADLPELERRIGGRTVDVLGTSQQFVLFNDLNYVNRPVFHSYQANGAELAQRNAAFFASSIAPDFVVLDGEEIDDHLPTSEDGAALATVLQSYDFAASEGKFVLLERRVDCPRDGGPTPRLGDNWVNTRVGFGEWVDLTVGEGRRAMTDAGYLKLDIGYSFMGSVRRTLLRAAPVFCVFELDTGKRVSYRVIPGGISAGALIDPFVESLEDLAILTAGVGESADGRLPRVVRLRVDVDPSSLHWFRRDVGVRIDALALPTRPPQVAGPFWRHRYGKALGHSFAALSHGEGTWSKKPGDALLLHAPAAVTLKVPEGAVFVRGLFGLDPLAANPDHATDGVTFAIEVDQGGVPLRLFEQRVLPPWGNEIAEEYSFEVLIPGQGARQIQLLAEPGGHRVLDWCWFADLEFAARALRDDDEPR